LELVTMAKMSTPLALEMAYPGSQSASRTTDTESKSLASADERVRFLDRYIELLSPVVDTRFHVRFRDNGYASAPSDWWISAALLVAAADVDKWAEGLLPCPASEIDLAWWVGLGLDEDPRFARTGIARAFRREGRHTYVLLYPERGLVLKHMSTIGPTVMETWGRPQGKR
jgi:hypothetical protein